MCVVDTKLADRTALIENSSHLEKIPPPSSTAASGSTTTAGDNKAKATSTSTETLLARLRHELAEAQRSKAELDARLKACTEELERVKRISQTNSKRVDDLLSERMMLVRAVKDRDEELKEKAKLSQVRTSGSLVDSWCRTRLEG